MLGSDPVSALLGAGVDPRAPKLVWKKYLRALIGAGAAVALLGPDVLVPADANHGVKAALYALIESYPTGTRMPPEKTGKLAGRNAVDLDPELAYARVDAYFRHLTRAVGKDWITRLLEAGVITPSTGLHVARSGMVAVEVPDAAAQQQWRQWAAETSGDRHELHTAPTLLVPSCPGGGVYLFRTAAPVPQRTLRVGGSWVDSGDVIIPIPPTRQNGQPVMRLGPCRMLPGWLQEALLRDGVSSEQEGAA